MYGWKVANRYKCSIPEDDVIAVEPNCRSNNAKKREDDDVIGNTKSTTCAKNNNESMIPPI
jgi:hypothetical protein